MKATSSSDVLRRIRQLIGGHADFTGEQVRNARLPARQWRVYCGEGRFDPSKRNATYSKSTGVALNFQLTGREAIEQFEICIAWAKPAEWRLLLHEDPAHADWPSHPRCHLQIHAPPTYYQAPPFSSWRIPLAEPDALKLLEYAIHHIR